MANNKQTKKKVKWYNIALPIITPAIALAVAIPVTWKITHDHDESVIKHTITYDDCHKDGSTITTSVVEHDTLTIMHTPEHRDEQGFLGWKEVKQDGSAASKKAPYFDFKNRTITQDFKLYGWWKYEVDKNDKDGKPYFLAEYIDGVGPYVKWNPEATPPEYNDFNLVLPKQLDGKDIIGVAPYGFADSKLPQYIFEIRTISLPDSIKVFSHHAFSKCTNLRIVNFPKNLFSIHPYCFEFCSKISDINLNEGLERIEDYAFNGNDDADQFLKNVTFPSTLKYVGKSAFWYSAVEKLDMSKCGNITIGYGAFYECWYLKNLILPEKLERIPDYCFYACNSLRYLNIPKGVKSIGEHAFDTCSKIRQITIADDSELLWIGNSAFISCYSLEKINLPYKLKYIDAGAFCYCYTLNNVSFANKRQWIYAYGLDGQKILDPKKTTTYQNAQILKQNLDERWMVEPEKLLDTTKNYNLCYVTNDQNQCYVTGYAEYDSPLTQYNIPAKITSATGTYDVIGIAPDSFSTNGVTQIEKVVFEKDSGGKNYLKYIGTKAFKGQNKLVDINLDVCSELEEIGDEAFRNCFQGDEETADLEVDLSTTNLKYIGDKAFYTYSDWGATFYAPITKIKLPQSLETLGSGCFGGLNKLKEIDIPKNCNLSKINYYLTEMDDGSYAWFTEPIIKGTLVETLDLSNTKLTYIARGTFEQLESTKEIKLPEGLLEIGSKAFYFDNSWGQSPLTTINIPSTCLLIGTNAFLNTGLTTPTFAGNTSVWYLTKNQSAIVEWDAKAKQDSENAIALTKDSSSSPDAGYADYGWLRQS